MSAMVRIVHEVNDENVPFNEAERIHGEYTVALCYAVIVE